LVCHNAGSQMQDSAPIRGGELLAALRDPEHFRSLVEDVHMVAVFLDVGGRVVHCNPYLLALTGWAEREVVGGDWFDLFVSPDEREETRRRFLSRVPVGTVAPVASTHIVTRTGERRLVRWNNTILRARDGELLGTASLGEDVTDQERTEEALSERNAFFRQLFDNAPVGIVLVDADDRVVDANPGWARMFGWNADDARGRVLGDLIVPGDLVHEGHSLSRAVREGREVSHDTVRRHRDGADVHVRIIGAPVELDGRRLGVFGIYLDIGDRKRAEEALRRSEERYALAARGANDGLWDWDLERGEVFY
jgi:PAS domain S-box-containing protein